MGKISKYIKTNEGHIYKMTSNNDIFIKVSPYKRCEDRRIETNTLMEMINDNKASPLKVNKALAEINQLWRNYQEKWVYCGYVYKTTLEPFSFKKAKEHKFVHHYVDWLGREQTYTNTYYVCMHHGRICWVRHTQYSPRLHLYKFTNIDTEPDCCDIVQWTSINNLKNIYMKNYDGTWIYV